jgi:hypothetical protein
VTDQDRNKAWGFALFADDVRAELGGKISLMGLYQADMVFPGNFPLPAIIPKLVIQIMYYEIVGSIEGDFSFKVTFGPDSQQVAEVPVSRADMAPAAMAVSNEPDSVEEKERIFHMRLPLILSPFPIQEMGRLRVRAHYADGAILKMGSIALRQIPEAEFQVLSGMRPPE